MKKTLMLASVIATLSSATDFQQYEISLLGGVVFPDQDTHLETQHTIVGELQFNDFEGYFIPELQLLQTMETDFADYPGDEPAPPNPYNGSTFISRIGLNALHEVDIGTPWWIPFYKFGAGYETLNDYHYFNNRDSLYLSAGGGLKYYTTTRFAVKTELVFMQKMNESRFDQNYGLFIGFSYTIGAMEHKSISAKRIKEHEESIQRQKGEAFESLLKQQH